MSSTVKLAIKKKPFRLNEKTTKEIFRFIIPVVFYANEGGWVRQSLNQLHVNKVGRAVA
jgi:hypothetical protein